MIGGDAMEGAIFYWFSWLGWIWATFFMSKDSRYRLRVSAGLLILIISSPYKTVIMGIDVHLPAFILMMFFILETFKLKHRLFFSVFLSSFILMLGYVSFLLFELFDPVWVIFDRKWMIAFGGMIIGSVLQASRHRRLMSITAGLILGEVLFSIIMKELSFPYPVASPEFLDVIASLTMLVAVWSAFNYVAELAGNYFNQGRGRQKST